MAQRRIGAFVRHELARHCLQDCPRTPSRDAADTVDDQGADASLCAVADAAPIRVVVQVDLSGVLVYGMLSQGDQIIYSYLFVPTTVKGDVNDA